MSLNMSLFLQVVYKIENRAICMFKELDKGIVFKGCQKKKKSELKRLLLSKIKLTRIGGMLNIRG